MGKSCWHLLLCFAFAKALIAQGQESPPRVATLDVSLMHGTILEHNPDIAHLITHHPTAVLLSYNRKTFGEQEWESRYGFPDWGISGAYQDMKNSDLGKAYSLYAHYNFHFFDRMFQFRIGQGLAYTTKPFDPVDNPRNNAYGTRITSSTYLNAIFRKENIWNGWGIHAGASIIHYSNANVRAPNNSTNTWFFQAGLNYILNHQSIPPFKHWEKRSFTEKIHYNVVARMGFNESDYRGSGQFPFYDFSFYADKRINIKSSLQLGTELFIGEFLKEYRDYLANSFPEEGIDGDENFQRVGIFAGHELHLGKTSLLTQLGYYVYWPIPFESRIYNRIGLQRRLTENVFASVTVHSHGAAAEGVSFGMGYRFR
ncbi:acyloxyacyl hydrolase [Nonlabens xiamenensis]|uniref:acyloxyacyl hydrolase n=1 Tax=Nonlabens xiamenensis TaxID=2341043 RepID=UPI000F60DCA1|nr:acyloxyacyl hydrolase [Nonlabens xiamenensis]